VNVKRTFLMLLTVVSLLSGCDRSSAPEAADEASTPLHGVAADVAALPFDDTDIAAADVIDGALLGGLIQELSSDRYGGRGPGSDGDRLARAWLAAELARLGYAPGGEDGGFEQPFDLIGVRSEMPAVWTFVRDGGQVSFAWSDDYIAGAGRQQPATSVDGAEVVFVGYGIQAPEYGWDDFEGVDLKGKMLLMLNNDPDWDPDLFAGDTRLYYGRWTYKYESAARQGAAGAIIIHTNASAGYPWQVVQTSWTGAQFELPAGDEPRIDVKGWLTEDAARRLVALAGKDLDALVEAAKTADFKPMPLGVTTSIAFNSDVSRTATANVLGLLPGNDPALADEVVVVTAHHDHLGIGTPDDEEDAIYNGAMDNASGVAQVLGIARALTALPEPPRRSVLINFVAAEEQGLLGSRYYAEHPTFPPGRMAANVNYDGGNIWGRTRDVVFIGKGKSSLDAVVEAVAGYQGRVVKPDQFPDRGIFYRSDQFNFARIGVPAVFLRSGTDFIGRDPDWGRAQYVDYEQHRYHQPSDEYSADWNLDGMVENARMGFLAVCSIADADEMPVWAPGDEFEAARLEALQLEVKSRAAD